MPEELWWCPGISRCCCAARCVPEVLKNLKPLGPHPVNAGSTRCIPIQCGDCRRPFQQAFYTHNAHRDYISWMNTKHSSNTKNYRQRGDFPWLQMSRSYRDISRWASIRIVSRRIDTVSIYRPIVSSLTSSTQSGCVTTAPPSLLRESIVVKPFNCFDAMGRNVNKQSQICGPDIFIKNIFSVLFLHAWITIFGSFSYLRE